MPRYDAGPVPAVEKVEIFPPAAVLDGEGTTQQINVRAKYADGTDRDVTSLAYFLSNNDNSAEIAQTGMVTARQRGEAFVMARFATHTVGSPFITLPQGLSFQWREIPANNYIDELVYAKFKKLRIQPSELCTDEEFLRRVTIDIIGLLPTCAEYRRVHKQQRSAETRESRRRSPAAQGVRRALGDEMGRVAADSHHAADYL